MSRIDKATVDKLANLSRLEFDDAQTEKLQGELTKILDFISQLSEADTGGVEPMTSVIDGLSTQEREDKVSEQDKRDEYLALAPKSEMGFYVVPRVVE